MKLGITRWKIVPSYRGTPCFLACETGLVQSLVPSAKPTKFATPSGALSGKSLQVILPAAVSITAVGPADIVAGGFTAGVFLAGDVCAHAPSDVREISERIAINLRISNLRIINLYISNLCISAPGPGCGRQDSRGLSVVSSGECKA